MRRTIYLPDELAAHVDAYLTRHKETNLSALVAQALREKVGPRERPSILELAGIVKHVRKRKPRQPEDQIVDRIR